MELKIGSASLTGGRLENQDCYIIKETHLGSLAVVCDGMGGVNGGKVAAETAIRIISEETGIKKFVAPKDLLINAIQKANEVIYNEGVSNPSLFGMGTTVTACLISENRCLFFHVGDSRIYQLREGKILYRTFDHSKVFELVSQGIISEEEARVSPMSNILTKVLGTSPSVEIDVSPELTYQTGDRFLLCTDGIWNPISEKQLVEIVTLEKPVNEIVEHLITYIDELGKIEGGRHDNMTVVLIEV